MAAVSAAPALADAHPVAASVSVVPVWVDAQPVVVWAWAVEQVDTLAVGKPVVDTLWAADNMADNNLAPNTRDRNNHNDNTPNR